MAGSTIGNAPSGENTSPDGTEKIPLSGSKYITIQNLSRVSEWRPINLGSPTRTSNTTFTTTTDLTSLWQKGFKLKFTDTTTKFANVVAMSAYSAGSMTVTIAGNTLVGNPSVFYYSTASTPLGFPNSFSFTPTFSRSGTAFTNAPTLNSATYRINGDLVSGTIDFTMPASAGGTGEIYASLPTTATSGLVDLCQEIAATGTSVLISISIALQKMNFYDVYPVAVISTTAGYRYVGSFKFFI